MKSLNQWLEQYAESHQNVRNIKIHTFAVPVIFFVTVGLLWLIPNPDFMGGQQVRIFHLILGLALYFYLRIGKKVFNAMLVMFFFSMIMNYLGYWIFADNYVWVLIIGFIIAWTAQFYGHKIEGKKPSFIADLQFLLIGPLWVMKKLKFLK